MSESQRIRELEAEVAFLEAEKRHYQWLAESTTDMISRHDRNGVFLYASHAARDLLGYEPDELLGVSAYDLFHPDDLEALLSKSPLIYYYEGFYQQTYRFRAKNGHYVWFETTSRTRRDPSSGELLDVLCVSRDVSRRVIAEAESRRHQQYIAHANRLATLGELASNIAHECNQPLATMANYAHGALIQLEHNPDQPASHLAMPLTRISEQVERLSARLRHIRRFVRHGDIRPIPVAVHDVIEQACLLCQWQCHQQGVSLDRLIEPDLPATLADPIGLEQILVNLLLNSLEACQYEACRHVGSPGRIRVSARRASPIELYIEVADNGPGIAKEKRQEIFAPFVSGHDNGLGMGLSISHSLAEAMGGSLTLVDSLERKDSLEPDNSLEHEKPDEGGATFRVILPFA
uniref:sensor histidine kinase n=1 Tax=Halomonas sp. TaxID=1486246 RepID=UPI00260F6976|nr:ATP-binding protein [Halomonas sp.]